MRKLLPYAGTALAAALAATAVSAVAANSTTPKHHGGNGSARHGRNVIWVVEHPVTDTQIHVGGGTADAIGDQLPFHNPIFDKTNTMQVGTDQGNCVRIEVGVSWECMWTTSLKGGQITVEGPFLDSGAPTQLAITGGTGRYASAGGWMLLRPNATDKTLFDFVFHLKPRGS